MTSEDESPARPAVPTLEEDQERRLPHAWNVTKSLYAVFKNGHVEVWRFSRISGPLTTELVARIESLEGEPYWPLPNQLRMSTDAGDFPIWP